MNTEQTLEFNNIKEKLIEYATTENAKKQIMELTPSLSEIEVTARLRETSEAKLMIEKIGNPPATALDGTTEQVEAASRGECLSPDQLEKIAFVLTGVRRLKDYLIQCKQLEAGLPYYEENLDCLDSIYEEITIKIRNGKVDDYATKELKSIREAIDRTNSKMHEKADSVMRANKDCMSDSFSVLRNGHICIPVKKEYKYKVNGAVIDKSATGNTVFIEPSAVAKFYEELNELRIDEENEERKILYTLSGLLADKEDIFRQNNRTIEKLDFIFAKAKLSLEMDGTEPKINTDRYIFIQKGRHPLMDKEKNVPLDFQIGGETTGIIITGPNTGGKTVAIKTVALNCFMAQCGLHVACEKADICMNNAILCDIGDGQNLSENLSTFSAHITNVLEILRTVSRESLVIMDELGSGTDPAEGMGIAIAILQELKKSGALFLVTTHYPEVKEFAEKESGILNARMTFDKESLRPLYHMVIGEAGESCAFYIAGKLGMPADMLKQAAIAAYGDKQAADMEKSIHQMTTAETFTKKGHATILKKKKVVIQQEALAFHLGDSVLVLPEKKIGIICQTADESGQLRVQMKKEKMWISHKRLQLHVPASELYPPDYDFSIIFDSVEKRKARHDMERKFVEEAFSYED